MDGPHGNMIQLDGPAGDGEPRLPIPNDRQSWYVLSGEGEIWRRAADGRESVTRLSPDVCIDIPLGTAFQCRCAGDAPLTFTCTALPPWPGDNEAMIPDGPWAPRVGADGH